MLIILFYHETEYQLKINKEKIWAENISHILPQSPMRALWEGCTKKKSISDQFPLLVCSMTIISKTWRDFGVFGGMKNGTSNCFTFIHDSKIHSLGKVPKTIIWNHLSVQITPQNRKHHIGNSILVEMV